MIFDILFWALIVISVIVTVLTFVYFLLDDGFLWSLFVGAVALVVSLFVSSLILGGYYLIATTVIKNSVDAPSVLSSETYTLTALNNTSALSGEYAGSIFVSYGQVSEDRVLNYIVDHGSKSYSLEQVKVHSGVRINEHDGEEYAPTVTVTKYGIKDDFWLGMTIKDWQDDYSFDVPTGTVSTGFTVDNSK